MILIHSVKYLIRKRKKKTIVVRNNSSSCESTILLNYCLYENRNENIVRIDLRTLYRCWIAAFALDYLNFLECHLHCDRKNHGLQLWTFLFSAYRNLWLLWTARHFPLKEMVHTFCIVPVKIYAVRCRLYYIVENVWKMLKRVAILCRLIYTTDIMMNVCSQMIWKLRLIIA